jgi:Alcohol dehydrogenase GroES-like domain
VHGRPKLRCCRYPGITGAFAIDLPDHVSSQQHTTAMSSSDLRLFRTTQVGDRVGVGCMVDSCRECPQCKADAEQFCSGPCTFTYNGNEQGDDGAHTKV